MKKSMLGAVAMLVAAGWGGAALANNFALTIENHTKSVVEAFYASPVGEDDWEEDMFENKVLAPGKSITVRFSDDRQVCKYDIRFEFQGDRLEPLEDTQNLCDLGTYTITE